MKISESKIEEGLSALYLIAAFAALGAGAPKWVFIGLLIKSAMDALCSIRAALREIASEKRSMPNNRLDHSEK